MDILINIIKDDSSDIEITEMVIETLLNVMASEGTFFYYVSQAGVTFSDTLCLRFRMNDKVLSQIRLTSDIS